MGFQGQNNANMYHQQNSMSYQNCVARAQNHDDVKNVIRIHNITLQIRTTINAMNPIANELLHVVELSTYLKMNNY